MVSSVATPTFNKDWFVYNGPYAMVKTEFWAIANDTIDKMHEAQKAACAQAREQLQENLTEDEKALFRLNPNESWILFKLKEKKGKKRP